MSSLRKLRPIVSSSWMGRLPKIAKDHLSAIAERADELDKDDLIIQELPEEYNILI